MHLLEQKIHNARKMGRRAIIPFLTAGFPRPDTFWKHIEDIDQAGADIIEIGVPFSDPVADGPVVEEASRRSLAADVTLADILDELAVRKGRFRAGLVLMGYYNPFLQYGLENLARAASAGGVHGFIIPDLPLDEAEEILTIFSRYDLALIPLVGPNTSLERMQLYNDSSQGYAYVVSVMGITGERQNLAPKVADTIRRARQAFRLPLALGFGLSKPEQLALLPEDAQPDAAVMGSALLKYIDKGGKASDFLADWMA